MVGDYFVLASTSAVLKQIIDAQGGETGVAPGLNAGFWLRPAEIRTILEENRQPLVAQTMMKEGLGLAEARARIDMLLDLGRFLRDASLVAEESRGARALRLELVAGPVEEYRCTSCSAPGRRRRVPGTSTPRRTCCAARASARRPR
jgi:hypothetical protein